MVEILGSKIVEVRAKTARRGGFEIQTTRRSAAAPTIDLAAGARVGMMTCTSTLRFLIEDSKILGVDRTRHNRLTLDQILVFGTSVQ